MIRLQDSNTRERERESKSEMTASGDEAHNNNNDRSTQDDIEDQKVASFTAGSTAATTKATPSVNLIVLAVAVLGVIWGSIMTGLYVNERNSKEVSSSTSPTAVDTTFRSLGNNTLGVGAISHINVVVNDTVDIGLEYYKSVLGFEPASNADGLMDYRAIANIGFCVDAGFEDGDCVVDIIFLKHPIINLYLELFYYYKPVGDLNITLKSANDAGGVRHVALEVLDAVETYNTLQGMDHKGIFITKETPIPLDPFPYTFFYWIDKYGVQWEFEQGRPVAYYHVAGITG
jgi:catechol 2,3-dioxygenase-like lactoylglutathione lyase family enzyme